MKTAELLTQRLRLVYRWYEGLVKPDTGMLEYLYVPQTDAFVHEKSPIRDIASVWDVELLGDFLGRRRLGTVVRKSLAHYDGYLVERDGYIILDSHRLREPSSIAHSAFMALALLRAPPPIRTRQISALAEGTFRTGRPVFPSFTVLKYGSTPEDVAQLTWKRRGTSSTYTPIADVE